MQLDPERNLGYRILQIKYDVEMLNLRWASSKSRLETQSIEVQKRDSYKKSYHHIFQGYEQEV
jgi:hypothetical protein